MGLDAHLYRATKKYFDAHEDYERKYSAYCKWGGDYVKTDFVKNFYASIPKRDNGEYVWDELTQQQKDIIENIKGEAHAKAKEIGIILDEGLSPVFDPGQYGLTDGEPEEIEYWCKEWRLHDFIVKHYWKNKERDNLIPIPLTKENLKEISEAGFYADTFDRAANLVDDEHVVYYFAWY